ncbi:MAG TPA: glutamine--tRNA ligase/YqeY domain fusion protein [Anaerolineae bacterium]|nr:glutamine--tRNA ligase/YqeY domain fusion protein [Anaerolineae bacterium]
MSEKEELSATESTDVSDYPTDVSVYPTDVSVYPTDFIREAVAEDLRTGRYTYVRTRFPPEPNGYLHIGHVKAFTIDFDVADEFGGEYNLRFDDTNPVKEEVEYVEAQKRDIRWLGYDWEDKEFYASDYFDQLYEWAIDLIKQGKAYVDNLSPEEISEYRGRFGEPGRESPYRDRPVEENLALFEKMRAGEFAEGEAVLRAKIDMQSGNMNMRDPVMYRILHASHHRTGDKWCIYPMYDWAHGQSDSIEGVTHSFCDLGYEDHRPLYNWFVEQLGIFAPRQIEFARFNLSHTVLSKRFLLQLVREGRVAGWDDPRMPTLAGMRRRGYTPEAILAFIRGVGVSKKESLVDMALLEYYLREHLNKIALRVMGVLRPLKVTITNYPEGKVEELEAINNPEDEGAGTRMLPFSRELYIEQEDFREDAPKKWFRLAPGAEVRLKHAYYITCQQVIKDPETGEVVELLCTYDPESRGGSTPDGRRVKGTLHWVSAPHAVDAEVRRYDRLFTVPEPMDTREGETWTDFLNPSSLEVLTGCKVEPGLADAEPGTRYQFLRLGYFVVDPDSTPGRPVFNETIGLRDTWAKIENK